jgi:hypothetical protein
MVPGEQPPSDGPTRLQLDQQGRHAELDNMQMAQLEETIGRLALNCLICAAVPFF